MRHLRSIFIAALVVCLWTSLTAAQYNCYRRRPPPLFNYQYCCRLPKARIELFPPQCRQFAQFDIFGQNRLCGMECMFSVTSSLNNNVLNLANVKVMLEQVYEDPDIADAKYSSYEDCADLIQDKMQRAENFYYPNLYRWIFWPQCSSYASIYAICAQIKMTKYCPESFWRNNDVCENVKEFVENCEDQIFNF